MNLVGQKSQSVVRSAHSSVEINFGINFGINPKFWHQFWHQFWKRRRGGAATCCARAAWDNPGVLSVGRRCKGSGGNANPNRRCPRQMQQARHLPQYNPSPPRAGQQSCDWCSSSPRHSGSQCSTPASTRVPAPLPLKGSRTLAPAASRWAVARSSARCCAMACLTEHGEQEWRRFAAAAPAASPLCACRPGGSGSSRPTAPQPSPLWPAQASLPTLIASSEASPSAVPSDAATSRSVARALAAAPASACASRSCRLVTDACGGWGGGWVAGMKRRLTDGAHDCGRWEQ